MASSELPARRAPAPFSTDGNPWTAANGNPWTAAIGEADSGPGGSAQSSEGNGSGEGGGHRENGSGWFRGNLHCHTTESDGRVSPQAAADWFEAQGYRFLALTDHNCITDPAQVRTRGLCLIPATELTATGGELGTSYHLISLGLPVGVTLPLPTTPAVESIAWLRGQGAAVFVAHPYWSGLTMGDLLSLPIDGIEIYNGGTVLDSQKGDATVYWDEGNARGAGWWGIAVDDTHWHTIDRGTGWVMVRAPALTPQAICHALVRGHFYASTGPEILRVAITPEPDGGAQVVVETSPCAAIYALGHGTRNQLMFDQDAMNRGQLGGTITRATFHVRSRGQVVQYVRIQCLDWQRRSAWTNPLYF